MQVTIALSILQNWFRKIVLTLHEGKIYILNPTYHIKSEESIDPAEAVLLMTAGGNFFSYALMKHLSKEIVEFGYYSISNGQKESWADFFENNEVLSEKYQQSAIAFNLSESILIPSEHYKAEETEPQLDLIFGQNFYSVSITEHLPEWNVSNVARVSGSLHSAFNRRFGSGISLSTNSVFLKNVSGENQNSILVDFRTDEFSVLVFKENKLQLLKAFSYSSPEDVLYYLLKICQQTKQSQQEVKVVLAGLIEKNSAIFRELYKYFINLEFEELPAEISIADALNECPRHYFSSICKLATCVL